MLSFNKYKDGKAIAVVMPKCEKILYLYENMDDDNIEEVKYDKNDIEEQFNQVIANEFKNKKKIKTNDIEILKKYLLKSFESGNDDYNYEYIDVYNDTKKKLKKKLNTEINLLPGEYFQVLPTKKSECLIICGPSGSGKSTYASNYYKMYCEINKNPKLIIFSRVNDDEAFDNLKNSGRMVIDQELVENPIQPSELKDRVVIMDDIDQIGSDSTKSGKQLRESIIDLRDKLLETRRHDNITLICTSHHIFNYKATRTMLLEADSITYFPKSSGVYHINRLLSQQIGLSKTEILKINKINSRWITIYKQHPQYLIHEHGCFILNQIKK